MFGMRWRSSKLYACLLVILQISLAELGEVLQLSIARVRVGLLPELLRHTHTHGDDQDVSAHIEFVVHSCGQTPTPLTTGRAELNITDSRCITAS